VERPGWVNRLNPATGKRTRLAKLPVRFTGEDGLIGMALDPDFTRNKFIYLYFGDPVLVADTAYNVLARFVVGPDSLLQGTRRDLLRIPVVAEGVSHSGGSLAFDSRGNLYLSTGDNTNPFKSDGYAPLDDRPGQQTFDSQRSAGNSNDLRGKILRIHPTMDIATTDVANPNGLYTIPKGNLFPVGTAQTRPEIYVMGCRNPYRINLDLQTDVLYWGEVGPDAGKDSVGRGPRGHDEFNRATEAGNRITDLTSTSNAVARPSTRRLCSTSRLTTQASETYPLHNPHSSGIPTIPPLSFRPLVLAGVTPSAGQFIRPRQPICLVGHFRLTMTGCGLLVIGCETGCLPSVWIQPEN
jgi:hypothetical protein